MTGVLVNYLVIGIEMPLPGLELVFLKVIGIGENVIGIFNNFFN